MRSVLCYFISYSETVYADLCGDFVEHWALDSVNLFLSSSTDACVSSVTKPTCLEGGNLHQYPSGLLHKHRHIKILFLFNLFKSLPKQWLFVGSNSKMCLILQKPYRLVNLRKEQDFLVHEFKNHPVNILESVLSCWCNGVIARFLTSEWNRIIIRKYNLLRADRKTENKINVTGTIPSVCYYFVLGDLNSQPVWQQMRSRHSTKAITLNYSYTIILLGNYYR